MSEYHVFLKDRQIIADNTMEVTFTRPQSLQYQPGQFMNWIYLNQPLKDKKGDRRSMSFASSPSEENLKITMRMSDTAWKQSLLHAKPGTEFLIIGPAGKFLLPQDTAKELVFIAGGVGITPFRSMLKYILDKKLPYQITLLYSNLCMTASTYFEELREFDKQLPNLRVVFTMTGEEKVEKEWDGRCGLINEQMIRDEIKDIMKPIYMIVGPPAMVEAMQHLLTHMGLPKEHVMIEKFTGL